MPEIAATPSNPAPAAAGKRSAVSLLLALALLGLAGGVGWSGGPWSLAALTLATLAGALLMRRTSSQASATAPNTQTGQPATAPGPAADAADQALRRAAGRAGAEVMVTQVVPVWGRQLALTRESADAGLQQLLMSVSTMSSALDTLMSHLQSPVQGARPGAADQVIEAQSEALEALLVPMRRAFAQRGAMVSELGRLNGCLADLQRQARQIREVARHTRLVSFNASIEAQRAGGAAAGTQAVAAEVRMLAVRTSEIADQLERTVASLNSPMVAARRDAEIHDTTDTELQLEIELRAREALTTLLDGMGAKLGGSSAVQQAGSAVRDELELAFTHFQFGDRLSQMLDIIGQDMDKFARWVALHPSATQSDAAEWLAQLEARYTMDEQRSQHHGNAHIERASVTEFF